MTNLEKKPNSTPGRPRSDQSHRAILQAAREILEQEGYRAMTIEAIAARAGVSKKTIYRWWPSKAAVALEALAAYTDELVPFPDTGSLERDLLTYFEYSIAGLRSPSGDMLRGLAAEAQLDPEFEREFQRSFIVPRKEDLVALLKRGAQRGELAPDIDLHVLADMIYGAKWYRLLLYPSPLDDTFARELVAIIRHLKP
ncbi:MAG TPA: TetR/AcrR family transcriptional regulator [Ktedonosporobacter sp.]|nr:TetR/AcrR family transcriptional regulator [Ktedonosporobacter sp.]